MVSVNSSPFTIIFYYFVRKTLVCNDTKYSLSWCNDGIRLYAIRGHLDAHIKCEISRFPRRVVKDFVLIGYCAVYVGSWLLAFPKNVLVHSWRVKRSKISRLLDPHQHTLRNMKRKKRRRHTHTHTLHLAVGTIRPCYVPNTICFIFHPDHHPVMWNHYLLLKKWWGVECNAYGSHLILWAKVT